MACVQANDMQVECSAAAELTCATYPTVGAFGT
jgi:hypothetical protein